MLHNNANIYSMHYGKTKKCILHKVKFDCDSVRTRGKIEPKKQGYMKCIIEKLFQLQNVLSLFIGNSNYTYLKS